MREIIVPPLVNVDPDTNVTDLVVRQAAKASNPALFSRLDAAGQWQDVRATEFLADVSALAKGLMASGVAAGDRVGIMSRTRYEWALIDFAIWFAGAVSVPIYETSSPSQVAWNLGDSGAVAAFGESAHHEDIIRQAATSEGLTALGHVWQLEGDSLDEVRAAGAGVSDAELEARRSQASLNDVATIIYTSGTTGRPKGCELTHGNFVELSENALVTSLGTIVHEQARTIMFLPHGPRLRTLHLCAGSRGRRHGGAHPGYQEPAAGSAELQTDLYPRRPARFREGLQLGPDQGRGRRQGRHLPPRRGHRHRILPGPAGRQGRARA